jgi:hypothetical protein
MTDAVFELVLLCPDTDGNYNVEIPLVDYDETGTLFCNVVAPVEISRTLAKAPIVIPIPHQDSKSFDIGFVDSDTINVNVTSMGGLGGDLWEDLVNAFKYKVGISTVKPYKLQFYQDEEESIGVVMRQLSYNLSSGHGTMIDINMTFDVVATT